MILCKTKFISLYHCASACRGIGIYCRGSSVVSNLFAHTNDDAIKSCPIGNWECFMSLTTWLNTDCSLQTIGRSAYTLAICRYDQPIMRWCSVPRRRPVGLFIHRHYNQWASLEIQKTSTCVVMQEESGLAVSSETFRLLS